MVANVPDSTNRCRAQSGFIARIRGSDVRFSNRPFEVKRFQTIRHCSVDVTRGLVLPFGIGTKALPAWDSRTRWNIGKNSFHVAESYFRSTPINGDSQDRLAACLKGADSR